MSKKKALLILATVFGVLTFCGAAYVWLGNANAGFACIPMIFTLIFSGAYSRAKNK